VIIGTATFFILPRDPATAKFLSESERQSVVSALKRDREFEEEQEDFSWSTCLDAFKAPQMWLIFVQFFCSGGKHFSPDEKHCRLHTVMLYSLAFFTPSMSTNCFNKTHR
jgi:hypothetical protein